MTNPLSDILEKLWMVEGSQRRILQIRLYSTLPNPQTTRLGHFDVWMCLLIQIGSKLKQIYVLSLPSAHSFWRRISFLPKNHMWCCYFPEESKIQLSQDNWTCGRYQGTQLYMLCKSLRPHLNLEEDQLNKTQCQLCKRVAGTAMDPSVYMIVRLLFGEQRKHNFMIGQKVAHWVGTTYGYWMYR